MDLLRDLYAVIFGENKWLLVWAIGIFAMGLVLLLVSLGWDSAPNNTQEAGSGMVPSTNSEVDMHNQTGGSTSDDNETENQNARSEESKERQDTGEISEDTSMPKGSQDNAKEIGSLGESLGEKRYSVDPQNTKEMRNVVQSSYTVRDNRRQNKRPEKSEIEETKSEYIGAIQNNIKKKQGYGVANIEPYGNVNYGMMGENTIAFAHNNNTVQLNKLQNVSVHLQNEIVNAGKENFLNINLKGDPKRIGQDIQVAFYKEDHQRTPDVETSCEDGSCQVGFVYTKEGEKNAKITVSNSVSTWTANLLISVNVTNIEYELVSRNTSHSNNRFALGSKAEFTVDASQRWKIRYNEKELLYRQGDRVYVSKNRDKSNTVVKLDNGTSPYESSMDIVFMKPGEYEITHSAFPGSLMKWQQESVYNVKLQPKDSSPVFMSTIQKHLQTSQSGGAQTYENYAAINPNVGEFSSPYELTLDFGDGSSPQVLSPSYQSGTHYTYERAGVYMLTLSLFNTQEKQITQIRKPVYIKNEGEPLAHIRYREEGALNWKPVQVDTPLRLSKNVAYEFDGSLSDATYKDGRLEYHWFVSEGKKTYQTKKMVTGFTRLTGKDSRDYLYLLVKDTKYNKQSMLRIPYIIENKAPFICFSIHSDSGITPFSVRFDASCSKDPDGQILAYRFDFGDGNVQTFKDPNPSHVYHYDVDNDPTSMNNKEIAIYTPLLEIKDTEGNWHASYDSVDIRVQRGKGEPSVRLELPYGYTFVPGEELEMTAYAQDKEDGLLKTWYIWYFGKASSEDKQSISECKDTQVCQFNIPKGVQKGSEYYVQVQAQDKDGHSAQSAKHYFLIQDL